MPRNQIICAIDVKDLDKAKELCAKVKPYVGMVKLGLEFFTANGPEGVKAIRQCGVPVFLDLKFHDIPNTVAESVRACVNLDVAMLTVHAGGGKEMMKAAIDAARDETLSLSGHGGSGLTRPLIFGVTVLTSMDEADLQDTGVKTPVDMQVLNLAKLASEAGIDGVVCSPLEVSMLRKEYRDLKLVVPGIRPEGSDKGDQKRVMTPKEAYDADAYCMVIGRPITKAKDPAEAARAIMTSIYA